MIKSLGKTNTDHEVCPYCVLSVCGLGFKNWSSGLKSFTQTWSLPAPWVTFLEYYIEDGSMGHTQSCEKPDVHSTIEVTIEQTLHRDIEEVG